MSLPLLPGNTFSSNPGRENFSKSHHFDVCNSINMNVGEYKVSDLRTILASGPFDELLSTPTVAIGSSISD